MMPDSVADWSQDEMKAHYRMGSCHIMALAISRATDLPLGVMWNDLDWQVEPDEEGLGGVREVVHVYVDCGDGRAIDVEGIRSVEEMRRDLAGPDWEACPCEPLSEQALLDLVHQSGCLAPYDEEEVDEADEVIRRNPILSEAIASFVVRSPGL